MNLKNKTFFALALGLFVAGVATKSVATIQSVESRPEVTKGDILDLAKQCGKFTILLTAIERAGLTEEFKKEGPFTVLAPTDEAFKRMSEGELEDLLKDKDYLKSLLLVHVIEGQTRIRDAVMREELRSIDGTPLFFHTNEAGTFVNDSKIIMADIEATNGMVHVIDTVLYPFKK
jgi:uncharacterized surface protein with fasciclin (FAS1) repeats